MVEKIISEIEKVIKGKREKIEFLLCAFLAGEHVLMEDIPGVGKTTLAKTFASVLGLDFKRIQFTADMLPGDITGFNYFDVKAQEFILKKGPVFTDILLADEINRASPKAQSALLEAMAEGQVSIDGVTYPLSGDFFVIATQNPKEHGIFPLPLSQIDRFGVSFSIGYPDKEAEKLILKRENIKTQSFDVHHLKEKVKNVYVDEKIYDLILDIGEISRNGMFETGLSTRALISLLEVSKAYAIVKNREFAIDEDVVKMLEYTANHRLNDKKAHEKIIQTLY